MKFKSPSGDSININRDDLREVANRVFNEDASLDELTKELIGNRLDNSNAKTYLENRVKNYIKSLKPTKSTKLVITLDNLSEKYANLIKEDIENKNNINGHKVDRIKIKLY